MRDATDSPADCSERLQALIGDYLDAVQSGRPVDREAFLAANPDLADGFRTFLVDYDQFQHLAAPLRDIAGAAPTLSQNGAGDSTGSCSSADTASKGEDSAAPPSAGTRIRYFGDYDLLRTLGEGGMGIVFEARQRSLDRIVALKMIRAGRFAGEDDLRRFRNEAEAVAKLDHPHIVPVYEVGEHDGHSYFSMKRIEGTSLATDPSGYRDRPREAARLVSTMAKALHHAHQRGVLHRDIKPSNVLLDARREPHLTDFGLAKWLEGPGAGELTRTGAILGTPAYMAPEQASGQRGEVTTATDVYGLGALLYALLTGHAPFRGESVADILLLVREHSPQAIRKSNAKVPRDLETICMRCLEREPRRRYATADAVARELDHWLSGKPITARPTGKLERSWMWCRRNRLVAGLTASVAVAFIASTAVSTIFAVRGSRRARGAQIERVRAEHAENETKKARNEIEETFARSLIQPLDDQGDAKDVLGQLEAEALWELAGDGSGSLGFRFLDEASQGEMTTRQLCARYEPALIAAVGLDPKKREHALALLTKRVSDTGLPPAQKAEIALMALVLADRPGPVTETCAEAFAVAIKAESPPPMLDAWKNHLSRDIDLLEPDTMARLILMVLHREKTAAEFGNLALPLAQLASRLEPARAASVCEEALALMADIPVSETDYKSGPVVTAAIAALVKRMPRGEAVRSLTEILGRLHDSGARQRLAAGLGLVLTSMSPDDLADLPPAVPHKLADAFGHERDERARERLAADLAKLAKYGHKLEPSDVRPVVQSLAAALKAEKDSERRGQLASILAPIAEHLGPEESAQICLSAAERLSADWTKTNGFEAGREWIQGLWEATIRLPIDVAPRTTRVLATAADSAVFRSMISFSHFQQFLDGLSKEDATRTARLFVTTLARETDPITRWWLAASLCILAEKMDPDEAARVCGPAVGDMGKTVAADAGSACSRDCRLHLIDGFVVVASRQTRAVASRSARLLADMIRNEDRFWIQQKAAELVKGLVALADRMEPAEAQRVCGDAAQALAGYVRADPDYGFNQYLASDLAVLAGRMKPTEAERICGDLARACADALKQSSSDFNAASCLAVLASRLEPVDADGIFREVARLFSDTLDLRSDNVSVNPWPGLALVAKRLNPVEAARMLADVLTGEMDADTRQSLAKSLADAAGRLEPAAATRVCERAIGDLFRARSARARSAEDRRGFDSAVAALLPRLNVRNANARAAILAAMMCSEGDICCEPKREPGHPAPSAEEVQLHAAFSRVLTDTSPAQRDLRTARITVQYVGPGLAAPTPSASIATGPWPCRLSTQELVDLLKMPTCFGRARRLVLDQLGTLHSRRFANHWEFVHFAAENQLPLDLTTAPQRPDPASLGFQEARSR